MSKQRAKGTGAETAVVEYLRTSGHPRVERRALSGQLDRGDIAGIPDVVIEVKNCARMALSEWMDEAQEERANDRALMGVVWHKRKGKGSPADWYVTMRGDDFTMCLRALAIAGFTVA